MPSLYSEEPAKRSVLLNTFIFKHKAFHPARLFISTTSVSCFPLTRCFMAGSPIVNTCLKSQMSGLSCSSWTASIKTVWIKGGWEWKENIGCVVQKRSHLDWRTLTDCCHLSCCCFRSCFFFFTTSILLRSVHPHAHPWSPIILLLGPRGSLDCIPADLNKCPPVQRLSTLYLGSISSPVNLVIRSLDCGRKPDFLVGSHTRNQGVIWRKNLFFYVHVLLFVVYIYGLYNTNYKLQLVSPVWAMRLIQSCGFSVNFSLRLGTDFKNKTARSLDAMKKALGPPLPWVWLALH